jgi:hypothetical protein
VGRERTNEKLVVRGFFFPLDTTEIHHWDSILMVIELCRGGGELVKERLLIFKPVKKF